MLICIACWISLRNLGYEFKERGIGLKVWEVDSPEAMKWFIREDVDIMETNFPEIALEISKAINKARNKQ